MADEVDVDELLRRGGQRVAAPGGFQSFARGASQGVSFGFGDEMAGASAALGTAFGRSLRRLKDGRLAPDSIEEELAALGDSYRQGRDEVRLENEVSGRTNSGSYLAGELGGGVATGLATGGAGSGVRGAALVGAAEGGAAGLGTSEADLTLGDSKEYARALGDVVRGAEFGGMGGVAGHVVGSGLRRVGTAARGALGRARGELLEQAGAERAAAEEAARAADVAELRARAVDYEAALKMDKARSREVARERAAAERAQRGAQGGGRGPGQQRAPLEDPDTRVLKGHAEGARKLRKDNAREVLDARERLKRTDITPEERLELEEYVAWHGDAVDNPVAFRLQKIESDLRKKYSPEVVERLMKRFDPRGNAVSRRAGAQPGAAPAEQPMLPERTQVAEPADWMKRGHDPMEVVRQGGGGSAWRDFASDARTVVDDVPPPGRPSFSQEEVVARHRNARGEPAEAWRAWREWEEAPQTVVDGMAPPAPGMRRLFRVEGVEPGGVTEPVRGHQWFTDRLGVADEALQFRKGGQGRMVYLDVPEAEARKMLALNREAPRFARASGDMGREWAVPEKLARRAEEVPVQRESTEGLEDLAGIAADTHGVPQWERGVDGPFLADEQLVETAAGPRPLPPAGADEVTGALDMGDVVRQGRENIGGGGSAWDGFGEGRTVVDPAMQPVQRFDVLGQRPAPRAGQPYEVYGAPRRAFPSEEVAVAEEAMAARRAAAAGADVGMGRRASVPSEPTAGARPRAMQDVSMRAPEDAAALPPEATRATQVPQVVRPQRPAPDPVRVIDRGGQTRLGRAPLDVRLQARPSAEEVALGREKGALLHLGLAGYEGARRAHNFVAAPIGALVGITKEALRNPAVRARAISLFKVQRLATVRPELWARVGAALQRAMEKGPERYEATRHALLLRDPEFRAADAEVGKELENLDEEALVEQLRNADSGAGG